jgi:hypothetical protein
MRHRNTPWQLSTAGASLLAILTAAPRAALAQTPASVLTWHNDTARTGRNLNETTLTPTNVNFKQFGKLFSRAVDGQIYAQPLYVPNVDIPGLGNHNVVYVATEHDSVYAFDAEGIVATPLWHVRFINPAQGITTVSTASSPCMTLKPEVGITSTPVIDSSTGTLYVVAETSDKGKPAQHLHALDIASGVEKFGGPVLIQAAVSGVAFDPTLIQRPGLLLLNDVVYLSYASLCAPHPYHGWVLGYNAQNVKQQEAVFITTPHGKRGGIWQSGAGLAADQGGNIYFMDGDGTFDANTGGSNYGMSMIRLSTSDGGLTVADYFSPFNEASLSVVDRDLGSGGVLVLPTQSGPYPHEILGADKEGKIFVVDRDNMGKFNPARNQIVQTLRTSASGYFSSPAYWRGRVYYAGVNDYLRMYTLIQGRLSTPPVSKSATRYVYPGSTPSISASGTTNGIVWSIQSVPGDAPAVLHAYDATNLANELYNSRQAGSRDQAGVDVKFAVPTVANGRVYIGTKTQLDAYGLLTK